MVSTLNLEEKYNKVRRNFCFYLDIQEHGLARSLSRRLHDMGLQQEVFLTSRVTHVVVDGAGAAGGRAAPPARCSATRASDAMQHRHNTIVRLTVQKAISLLDKLYDTFLAAPRKAQVKFFNKHYLKIEFLDKVCRPVFKEFDEWPEICLEPDPPKREKKESTTINQNGNDINQNRRDPNQKMTRKSRPRIKDREDKEPKGGYCEMCNAEYVDGALHRRSPHHLAFVRDHTNFLALDSLITAGADVASFLDKQPPLNGERRSLRNMCNGDHDPKTKRSKRSQSPDSTVNGSPSPKRNGIDDDRKHNTRCSRKGAEADDRHYYKVVGVSTKLRSSGGFITKRKDSPPSCNGAKPLVVKFRKVRRSELSVLSDEAEQFMFPKRASSTASDTSDSDDDDDDKHEVLSPRRKTPPQPQSPATNAGMERRRQARPLALKEESSEEDGWPEDKRPRKRRSQPPVKRGRRVPLKPAAEPPPPEPEPASEPEPEPPEEPEPSQQHEPAAAREPSPLREPSERCMKWEDGRLRYTPAVEQLEFAFESVPKSEPWFETFKRQDEDKLLVRNIPQYFALYTTSPKLPYEVGPLPPLKPNCCPLSNLTRRDDKPGPSRARAAYGTRGMKRQRTRKRTAAAALLALEAHPRKSPREHASTLAILGSVGLLQRRKHAPDDAKSTASEDTGSDVLPHAAAAAAAAPTAAPPPDHAARLQRFLQDVYEDAGEYEVSDDAMDADAAAVLPASAPPDLPGLLTDCDDCDIIRNEIREGAEARARSKRAKFKKKNRTGWPSKRRPKKDSRTSSLESGRDGASASGTPDVLSEEDPTLSEAENDKTLIELKNAQERVEPDADTETAAAPADGGSLRHKCASRSSASDSDDKEEKKKIKRELAGLLLQPVVKVTRVDPASAARRLRSANRRLR